MAVQIKEFEKRNGFTIYKQVVLGSTFYIVKNESKRYIRKSLLSARQICDYEGIKPKRKVSEETRAKIAAGIKKRLAEKNK